MQGAEYLKLTFVGHIPSKKNSRKFVTVGRRTVPMPSDAYRAWEKAELKTLTDAPQFHGPVSIDYQFWPGSLRLFDISNAVESVNDLLVKAEIIEDDNWLVLREMSPKLCGYDARNEHCIVTISAVKETRLGEAISSLRDKAAIKAIATKTSRTQKAVIAEYEAIARGDAA